MDLNEICYESSLCVGVNEMSTLCIPKNHEAQLICDKGKDYQ